MSVPRLLLRQHCLSRRIAILLPRTTRPTNARFISQTSQRCNRYNPHDPYEHLRNARPLVSNSKAEYAVNYGTGRKSRVFMVGCVIAAIIFYVANTDSVPGTGRRRFNFIRESWLEWYSRLGTQNMIPEMAEKGMRELPDSDPRARTVKRIMERLIPLSGMSDLDWEVHVIHADHISNAFVAPGGKVFVFTGLLRVCRNADALAAVLGHEIAHTTASHSGERASALIAGGLTSGSIFFLLGPLRGMGLAFLWMAAGGWYIQDILMQLPMTRKQETEADYIGLMITAQACYDPREAVPFWRGMKELAVRGGKEVPEMLSTHPSTDNRIESLTQWMPEALQKGRESNCAPTNAWRDQFRDGLRRTPGLSVSR